MAQGGKRSGAGRKSTWLSGCPFTETKLIRVPIAIAEQPSRDLVTNSLEIAVAASVPTDSINSVSSDIELSNYGWIQPPGAKKEHCFLKGKSLCKKWSYKESTFLHSSHDYLCCRECWVQFGKILEKNKTLKR